MIQPSSSRSPYAKPKWQLPAGVMTGIIAYNVRRMGLPMPVFAAPMWEGAGNMVCDLVGTNNGTISGANWVANGLEFDGNDNYALVDESMFDGFTEITVFSRCMTTQPAGDHVLISKRGEWSATGIPFEIQHSNKMQWFVRGNDDYLDGPTFVSGDWNSIVCTWSYAEEDQRIYIDGDYYSHRGMYNTITDNNAVVKIGTRPNDSEGWVGDIDVMIIWLDYFNAAQAKAISRDPYGLFRIPEELYAHVAAAAGVTIPVIINHLRQQRIL